MTEMTEVHMRFSARPHSRRLVVVGSGGFAREALDVIEDVDQHGAGNYSIAGVTGPQPARRQLDRLRARGIAYLGDDDSWLADPDAEFFTVAVGEPSLRMRLAGRYLAAGLEAVSLVHPSALVGRHTTVGDGSIVCAGAVISTNVRIGAFCAVNPNATIGHDAVLEDFVSVNPGAVISGEVVLGEGTLVGAGAVVLENLTIGPRCVIGASACVTKNIATNTTVSGVPARPHLPENVRG